MSSLLFLIEQLGVVFTFAASVFATAYYFASLRDGVIDESEQRLLDVGRILLRIGMGFILITFSIAVLRNAFVGNGTFFNNLFWFLAFLLAVMVGNEILLALHKEPNWLSPFLQTASWYAYFVAYIFHPGLSFITMLLCYFLWLIIALAILDFLKSRLISRGTPQRPS